MFIWSTSSSASGTYTQQLTPSTYKIDWEDLDADSYRSITTGNLIRSIVSKKWLKASFFYNYLTEEELTPILTAINAYPLYVTIKSPLFGTSGMLVAQCYVSRVSAEMINTGSVKSWNLSFDIIQAKKVSGQ